MVEALLQGGQKPGTIRNPNLPPLPIIYHKNPNPLSCSSRWRCSRARMLPRCVDFDLYEFRRYCGRFNFFLQALTFQYCDRLSVKDLKFKNSQQIHVTFSKSSGVKASRLSISAPGDSPNTDGIHITRSTQVDISDSVVGTGDDCISIVRGSSSITAKNIVCGPGHGIRF